MKFVLAWVVLPNLPYAILSISFCPARGPFILGYVIIGLCARTLGRVTVLTIALLFATADLLNFLKRFFGVDVVELVLSAPRLLNLDLLGEPRYTLMIAILAGSLAAMVYFGGRLHASIKAVPVSLALLVALAVAGADAAANVNPNYGTKYGGALTVYAEGLLFDVSGAETVQGSALDASGLREAHRAGAGRNLLVVVVEAMGAFAEPEATSRLLSVFDSPEVARRYDVSRGITGFEGSTTAAELRELCARRDSYLSFVDGMPEDATCLPRELADKGYETVAVHGFNQGFFRRDEWWPVVGFRRVLLGEQLAALGETESCGRVFAGACDVNLAGRVRNILAAPGEGPRFVYWLTLNTHVPVVAEEAPPTAFRCATADGPFADEGVCAMAHMWTDLLERVRAIALDPALPPMDVLVVGDHAPPLFTRAGRHMFLPDVVPWVALRARG